MKTVCHLIVLLVLLLGLPLAGVWCFGYDVSAYLEFPPRTQYVGHAPFSWPVFCGLAIIILAVILPFLYRVLRATGGADAVCPGGEASAPPAKASFPWWGWGATGLGLLFWLLAWTRFEWFEPLQLYTFSAQWFCYIVFLNALTYRRTGRCLLTHETGFFLRLFVLSAVFWWFFEYLNRFVQNWYYVECEQFSPLQYFILATLPFSTVLPAVLSTEEWLRSHPRCCAGLGEFVPIPLHASKPAAGILLIASAAGLFLIGRFPDQLFPLLWVAPLLLLVALRQLAGGAPFFPELAEGDWRRVFRLALAALICGFFWEMWNEYSLAQWIYSIPYVHRYELFEMPILGYAGYLPFGLECYVISRLIRRNP